MVLSLRGEDEPDKIEKIKEVYGFDPRDVVNRYRGFEIEDGVLWIEARDGGGNPRSDRAEAMPNFLNEEESGTYMYYSFSPLNGSAA